MATRDFSNKQEQYVANYLDGQRTPNSGAGHTKKGDILIDDFMIIECKTKTKETTQVSIKKEWIDTLRKESLAMGRDYWSIVFDFGKVGDEYAVVPLNVLKEIIDYIREDI